MSRWLRKLLGRSRRSAKPPGHASAFDVQREIVGRADPVVFDVGAHVGSVALEYRRQFPGASIHCFEPFAPSFEKLRVALAGDARAVPHPIALAATEGRATLHVNTFSATNSLLPTDARGQDYWGAGLLDTQQTLDVATTTLDAFCRAQGIARIDVLKLDVQGAELSVLEGARRMLAGEQVALIYTELILAPTYEGQRGLQDYLNLLSGHGYGLFALFNQVLRRHRLIQADVLFVSRACLAEYEGRTA